jgi:uncharacterized iron-regulated membrane protein
MAMMQMSLKSRRKLWLKVHLYLGLFAGAIFVVIGLTGSLLAFEFPLDEWLNPKLMTVPVAKEANSYLPLDAIVASGMKALPTNAKAISLGFPRHSGLAFDLWFEQPSPYANYLERHQVFINPYNAVVTGQRLLIDFERIWRDPFKDFILRLHYSLGLASAGMNIVGFIGIGLFFSVITGLILWWPSLGKLKKSLLIKYPSSSERLTFDLHKTFGFYSSIVLLFLIASGVYLIFPEYGRSLVGIFSPTSSPWPEFQSSALVIDKKTINLEQVVAITDARFSEGDYRWIVFPDNDQGVYVVGKAEIGEVNKKFPYRRLWIDQYSGKIIHEVEQRNRSVGDLFIEWIYPLHTGEAFGFTGQMIILISGLIPTALYVTGFIRWRQKRRAAKHHQLYAQTTK